MFNLAIIEKYINFSESWAVIPLFKSRNEEQLETYRPIKTSPVLDKVFKRILHYQIMSLFYRFNIPSSKRIGLIPDVNKSDALLEFHDITYEANKKTLTTFFLDFSKKKKY